MLLTLTLILLLPQSASALDLASEPIQPLRAVKVNAAKVALGEKLFFDVRLSANDSISCAHCHDLEQKGGADGLRHSFGIDGNEGLVNAPTVFNAVLNVAQFWDGRATTLEEQVNGPLTSPLEMGASWPDVVKKLSMSKDYRRMFRHLYTTGITPDAIRNAIAEFERSLVTVNSRFDRYLQGEEGAITAAEQHGYTLFKAYGCVSCHQGRNVGGNLYQTMGVMADYFADHPAENKADLGRFNVTGDAQDRHVFKVPSLRLAALTSPYLHNGSAQSLHEVIDRMAKYQVGRKIPAADVAAIIAFLRTLPGEYRGRPLLPSVEGR